MNIILGITGGIAAYKCPELIRLLKKQGHAIKVVMTESSKDFVTQTTIEAISGNHLHLNNDLIAHIELARWADHILIAPATANTMAKLSCGLADDLLTNICLATIAPITLSPAMNTQMWNNIATQKNIDTLQNRNFIFIMPTYGEQACGEVDIGRMAEPIDIVQAFTNNKLLPGMRILITAGPTHEYIDPVRYITNRSSGKMGYALARQAKYMGAFVKLVSGPCNIPKPYTDEFCQVITANEMKNSVEDCISDFDIYISAAAIADYRVKDQSQIKIKKQTDNLSLSLAKNPDILSLITHLPNRPFVVGFAAETNNCLEYGKQKLNEKKLDMIVINDVSKKGMGFDSDYNEVTIVTPQKYEIISKSSKDDIAQIILDFIRKELNHANLIV